MAASEKARLELHHLAKKQMFIDKYTDAPGRLDPGQQEASLVGREPTLDPDVRIQQHQAN